MKPCILVFGMPRSGTTWVGKLFDSHPDTLYRHEPDSVRPLSMPLFPDKQTTPRYRHELEQFVESLPRMREPKVVCKQPLFPKRYLSSGALLGYRASVAAAKAASRIRSNIPCPYRPTGANYGQRRLVWKSIESLGRLGVCVEALPNARAIHLMRHPCGYVASVLRGEKARRFGGLTPKADDIWLLKMLLATASGKTHGQSLDDIKRLTPEERLAWMWVLIQEKVLADIGDCDRVLTVRYEDVCANPIAMTRKMFEFAELDWQPQSERFVRASTRATDAGYYSVFKNPQGAAERWRSELEPQVIARIQRILCNSSLSQLYVADHAPMALAEVAP